MTPAWLLLFLVVASQHVDSQSTTGDNSCDGVDMLVELKRDVQRLLQQQQTVMHRLGKWQDISNEQLEVLFTTITNNINEKTNFNTKS